jgi:CRP-like cAMP-binding protein
MGTQAPGSRNEILRRLGPDDYERVRPHLQPVTLTLKQLLCEQGRKVDHVWFPESGVVSIVSVLVDGTVIETRTVGNEGLVGLSPILGVDTSSSRVFVQIPGRAVRMSAEVALAERRRGGPFGELILRFANATVAMLAQSVACNRAHSLEERMCRWLLLTHDRVGEDRFPLTQQFMAQMLGVRRPTVNLAGTALQRAGLIRYTRGKITIVDREGLEESSCECYSQMRTEFARSFGKTSKEYKRKR